MFVEAGGVCDSEHVSSGAAVMMNPSVNLCFGFVVMLDPGCGFCSSTETPSSLNCMTHATLKAKPPTRSNV